MSPRNPFMLQTGKRQYASLGVDEPTNGGGGGGDSAWVARSTDPPDIQYWVDPNAGSDTNDGSSPGNAWATFGKAVTEVGGLAGERVIGCVDGTFDNISEANNVAISVQGVNRTASERLWFRANNERAAIFRHTTGGRGLLQFDTCSYLSAWGFAIKGDATSSNWASSMVESVDSHHNHFYRLLATRSADSQYTFRSVLSYDDYWEECEGFESNTTTSNRHVFSNHRTERIKYTRCYANHQGANSGTDFIAYRANDSIFDNCVAENGGKFHIIAEDFSPDYPGLTALRVMMSGCIWLDVIMVAPTNRSGSGTHAGMDFAHNLIITSDENGIRSKSDDGTYENFTIYNGGEGASNRYAVAVEDLSHTTNAIRMRNMALLNAANGSYGEYETNAPYTVNRDIAYNNYYGSPASAVWDAGLTLQQNVLRPRMLRDVDLRDHLGSNNISTDPFVGQYGVGAGKTLVWVPSDNPMYGAGEGGANIGCDILYRYESTFDGSGHPVRTLTNVPLWKPSTGEFPHGVEVAGMNDAGNRLSNLGDRLGVSPSTLPDGYGS